MSALAWLFAVPIVVLLTVLFALIVSLARYRCCDCGRVAWFGRLRWGNPYVCSESCSPIGKPYPGHEPACDRSELDDLFFEYEQLIRDLKRLR